MDQWPYVGQVPVYSIVISGIVRGSSLSMSLTDSLKNSVLKKQDFPTHMRIFGQELGISPDFQNYSTELLSFHNCAPFIADLHLTVILLCIQFLC